ncbi:MAG: hypothetical protein KJ914_06020 [Gammaproteobacteria bacterium]|nr:hypothetical protein [Gammaproteobacteria bacterium]MBU1725528.1 hypothetical protein [Gammaproteobacteria bacterium]MBU2007386.1 hypothetical protein [Gammaproteobacteria bacterium]
MRGKLWGLFCAIFVCLALSACSQQAVKDEDGDSSVKKDKSAQANKTKNQQTAKNKTTFVIPQVSGNMPQLSQNELQLIADKIFRNEGGGNYNNLVHWNDGEDFASMGVGHFTWYPAGRQARFGNTFPDLLTYMQNNGVQLPAWLQQARYQGAPWRSKTELMYAKQTRTVQELQNLLYQTRVLQAAYIVERARRAMPQLVNSAPQHSRTRVAQNLNAVANTPGGWYVLVDYVNFKGEGLNPYGGYKGQNWGLMQVLEEMQPSQPGQPALHAFADAATHVLVRRVRNSPPARNEARWLAGWSNRINTYRYPGV